MENNHLTQLAQEILASSSAISWKQARSGGKGGQNVNKVSSKAQLSYNIHRCTLLTQEQKEQLFVVLANKINKAGELRIDHERSRDFPANKEACVQKFIRLLNQALTLPIPRKSGIPRTIDTTLPIEEQRTQKKIKRAYAKAQIKKESEKRQQKQKKQQRNTRIDDTE